MESKFNFKYGFLYLPWLVSILTDNPHIAYFIAWGGSFLIFLMSFSGQIKPLPKDVPLLQQILRPIFLLQLLFAGYMACSSIFFYLDSIGYTYFEYTGRSIALQSASPYDIAFCQQQYVLGHAAFVHGIFLAMKYPVKLKVVEQVRNKEMFLIYLAVISIPMSIVLVAIPGLSQFAQSTAQLSFVAGTLALAIAISNRNSKAILIASILYGLAFTQASLTGSKAPIIISILLLGIFLLPVFGKKLLLIFIPLMFLVLTVLPTYSESFRQVKGSVGNEQAKELALEAIKSTDSFAETNWLFLVYRTSEISMFIQFTEFVPSLQNFYGLSILKQSLLGVIPRVLWPGKPDMELMVMDRVYKAGVVDPTSEVSAKPATVVDSYLSAGSLGVFIGLLLYGLLAQFLAVKAEQLFGGFFLGTALVFPAFFRIFWLGNTLEFLVSAVFWGFIGMYIFHLILKRLGYLQEVEQTE